MPSGEPIGPTLIQRLLQRGEGVDLDYKAEQRAFPHGPDHEKAKLLKDVLAFANAYRDSDAFILIGVEEGDDDRPLVIGTDDHFDDADLQQFLNASGRLNRHVVVSYHVVEYDGKKLGVIRIPKQPRPFFTKQNFGFNSDEGPRLKPKVHANTVYFRRGSSTLEATPDDVYEMGRLDSTTARPSPTFTFQMAHARTHALLGCEVRPSHERWCCDSIPDFVEPPDHSRLVIIGETVNKDYHRQLLAFANFVISHMPITFVVKNIGNATANDVTAEIRFAANGTVSLATENTAPAVPSNRIPLTDRRAIVMPSSDGRGIDLRRQENTHVVTVRFGKVQAGETSFAPGILYLCPNGPLAVSASVRADELDQPVTTVISVDPTITTAGNGWQVWKPKCLEIAKRAKDDGMT